MFEYQNTTDISTDPQIKIKLETAFEELNKNEKFKTGDIICYKKGFQNKKTSGPFIVIKILKKPIFDDSENPSSIYFNEPLNIIVGFFISDNTFVTTYLDSRRMTLFQDE